MRWIHSLPAEPVLLYSELDPERWETRKVEVFCSGRADYAGGIASSGNTKLSIEPLPPIEEIGTDSQFETVEITNEEFEVAWNKAVE